jgi:hypothetical protein
MLAVIDIQSYYSTSELKEIIENVLEECEILLQHILCCLTDNAGNMMKLVSTLNQVLLPQLPTFA